MNPRSICSRQRSQVAALASLTEGSRLSNESFPFFVESSWQSRQLSRINAGSPAGSARQMKDGRQSAKTAQPRRKPGRFWRGLLMASGEGTSCSSTEGVQGSRALPEAFRFHAELLRHRQVEIAEPDTLAFLRGHHGVGHMPVTSSREKHGQV